MLCLPRVVIHYNDVKMGTIASQITSLTIVYSTVYSDADQRKHQSSASLVFVWGIHRGPMNSPHKWPVTRKMFPFDDIIMLCSDVNALNSLLAKPINTCLLLTHSRHLVINRPISQIPECTSSISHKTPLRTEMCTFLLCVDEYVICK